MIRMLMIGVLFCWCGEAASYDAAWKIKWVDLLAPAQNGNVRFNEGDTCHIKKTGSFKIIGYVDEDHAIVIYFPEKEAQTYGTECPRGAVFIVRAEDAL